MTFWQNMLHDITSKMQKKLINKQKLTGQPFFKVYKGNHGFYKGEKLKNLKSHFWPEKITNIGPEYTKKMQNSNILGVRFLRKVDFVNIVMR